MKNFQLFKICQRHHFNVRNNKKSSTGDLEMKNQNWNNVVNIESKSNGKYREASAQSGKHM